MKVVLSRQELTAALLFVSKDEQRFVLNGVNLEVSPTSKPIIVATDGRRLCVIETGAVQSEEIEHAASIIIHPLYIKTFCRLSKDLGGENFPWIELEFTPLGKRIQAKLIETSGVHLDIEDGAIIAGQYPDWRKVVPPKNQKRSAITDLGINSAMIGDFARAAKEMGSESPVIQMNLVGKDGAIEVKLAGKDNFYALIMPCKIDESVEYQPEFLNIVQDFPEKKKPEATTETTEEQAEPTAEPAEVTS